jgi:hypothetical protein
VEQAGQTTAAADLYLRAGRTAAADGDNPAAKRWLGRAITLSRDPALAEAARTALAAPDNR